MFARETWLTLGWMRSYQKEDDSVIENRPEIERIVKPHTHRQTSHMRTTQNIH